MFENLKNWKTTAMGIIAGIVSITILVGLITTEQAEVVIEGTTVLVETQIDILALAIKAIILTITGIWAIFKAKDG